MRSREKWRSALMQMTLLVEHNAHERGDHEDDVRQLSLSFEKNRRVVCKKNKTNSRLLSIRQGRDAVKARGEPRVNLKYSPRN